MTAIIPLGIIGGQEVIIIVVLVLILFGGKKIPELMRGLGRGIREFRDASSSVSDEVIRELRDKPDSKEESETGNK